MRSTYQSIIKFSRFALFLVLTHFGQFSIAAPQVVGSVNSTEVITDPINGNKKVRFGLTTGGQLEVSTYADDVIRVRYHWDGIWPKEDLAINKDFSDWPTVSATFQDDGSVYRIITPALEVEVVKSPSIKVHFKSRQGFYLSQDSRIEYDTQYDAVADGSYEDLRYTHALPWGYKLKATREMPAGEAYFGLGEYAGPMNRRNHTIQMWNSDTFKWEEGWAPMYMTLPILYGTQGAQAGRPSTTYGIFFNNPARPVFRMGTQSGDKYSFEAGDGQLDYFFMSGGANHQMVNVLNRYTELTGHPTMLPKWAFGYHLSRWSYNNQGWVEWLAQEFRNRDIPLDTIYLDLDYMDTDANDYYLDGTLRQLTFNYKFPNVGGMIDYTSQRGVKLVPLIEPWLAQGDPKWGEAAGQFHFIKDYNLNQIVTPIYFGNVSWLDFSSTAARNWWKGKLLGFLDAYPLAGIWNDLNEPADNETIARNGQYWVDNKYPNQWDSRHFHLNEKNMYCVRETSLTYDTLLTKYPTKRPFVLSRAGFPGIQKYALGWSGDNVASWDHCRHNIGLGVSVMMSGQANFGHDVGGFVGNPSAELLTRWHEWAAMTPFFRSHSIKGNDEREPWRYGSYYEGLLRNIIKQRYRMMPYLYTLAHQSTINGVPMNTPAVMHFQDDPNTHYRNDNDFMVGSHLLASPVYEANKSERWTYLPNGSIWYNWYNPIQKVIGGNWASQPAPVGQLPLWARAGAIIPTGPSMAYANQFVANFMDINVWPTPAGFSTEFTLHEDDGETWHYLAGQYARTRFVSANTASNFTFVIHNREGSYDTGSRHYYVKVRDQDSPTSVTVNGQEIPYDASHALNSCYNYDAASRLVIVKVPDTRAQTTISLSSIPGYIALTWIGNSHNWPTNGAIKSTDNFWVNTYTYPQNAAQTAQVVFSTNEGMTWVTNSMTRTGVSGTDDWWNKNLGTFTNGTKLWYWTRATDSQGTTKLDNNNYYKVTVGVLGPAIVWAGNQEQYPTDGNITTNDNVWLNIDSYPKLAGRLAEAIISTNLGVTWITNVMNLAGAHGNNDWWNKNLGKFKNGTKVWYWMQVTDSQGSVKIVNNGGNYYKTTVGTPLPALVWAGNLDQYPSEGNFKSTTDLWLNIESWPRQSAVSAVINYQVAGHPYQTVSMNLAGQRGNNDWWNKNLGRFSTGNIVFYSILVTDSYGMVKRYPAFGETMTVCQ